MTTSPSSRIGTIVGGRYQLEQLLGQGGMSAVYRALDPNLQRQVAVKLIHPHLSTDPEFITRFETEATAVARLKHPHIYQVHDFNHSDDLYYMVMEYVPGQTLDVRLKELNSQHRRFPMREVVHIMSLICDAADYAHRHDMIHRDLKPSNIMLNEEGDPVLMDFGVAKILGDVAQAQTATGTALGTAAYMSPEQAQGGKIDKRTDIYSLGVILYEIVSGERPYTGESAVTVMMKHINDPIPDVSRIDRPIPFELINIVNKALAKKPEHRYSSASEMARDLRAINLSGLGETARNPQITDDTVVYNDYTSGVDSTVVDADDKTVVSQKRPLEAGPDVTATPPSKVKSSVPLLALAAVALVAILGIATFFLWFRNTDNGTGTVATLPTSAGMRPIEGGDYTVGIPGGGRDQIAAKAVTVDPFWLDVYEATNADYTAYLAENPDAAVPLGWSDGTAPAGRENWPVEGLTYDAAEAYCLSHLKRLPTEAEWEAAARGPNGHLYPWGDDIALVELPRADAYQVGTISGNRSAFGIYDMAGNVWEWVSDPYEAINDNQRILRGGQYGLLRDMAYRLVGDPAVPSIVSTAGVRCAASEVEVLPGDDQPISILDESTILQDDFTNPSSGWLEQKTDTFLSGYHPPDYYHLQLSVPNSAGTAFRGLDLDNFTAETDVFIEAIGSETGNFQYGVAFRRQGNNFYGFTISPRTQEWELFKQAEDTQEILASGTDASITFKTTADELRVDADSSRLRLSLNGRQVADIYDSSYKKGDFGFYIASDEVELMHIHYDALTIRALDIPTDPMVIIHEDFTDPASGWVENSTDTILSGYHPPDYYHVQAGAPDTVATAFHRLGQADFTAEAEVFIEAVDTTDGGFRYGLTTRRTGDDYYAFTISPRTQEWAILKHTAGGMETLAEGSDPLIVISPNSDTLRVDAQGATQLFSMNGRPLGQITDSSLTGNDIGFYVENFDETRSHIHYDNFLVRQFDETTQLNAAEPTVEVEPTAEPEVEATPTAEPTVEAVGDLPSGANMVQLPANSYTVGAAPVLEVALDSFWIDAYEVTNNSYAQYLLVSGGEPPTYWANENIPNEKGDHPVQGLTWDAALAYCQAQNKRLPTEAEWEAAARSEQGWLYPWGNDADIVSLPTSGTYPVGSILGNRSAVGAYDMAGNVWEWVDEPYIETPAAQRVLRGGANNFQNDMTFRVAGDPTSSIMFTNAGVRCAASNVDETTATEIIYLEDKFDDVNSGWWQARAPIGPYFYGYHPTDFYHVQIQQPNGCLSVYQPLDATNYIAESEVFMAATDTEAGNFRYGLTVREEENSFYAFAISPRTGSWQVLKNSVGGMLLMDEGTITTLDGSSEETSDHLTVAVNGPQFTFWVNGELVSQLTDNEYSDGNIGFLVETFDETYVHTHFDEIKVTALPASTAAPTSPDSNPSYPVNTPLCGGTVATDEALGNFITHQVAPNESLSDIAAQFGVTVEAILEANGKDINDPSVIRPGQTIVIPQEE